MSPAEARAVLNEPDWRERFEEHCAGSRLPRWQAEEDAYEATLKDWRKFHFTWREDGKRDAAPAVDGIIALAALRIFAPRFTIKDVPRDGATGYQSDEHMWLSLSGEQWRIVTVEDRMLCLRKDEETKQIDLTKAKWEKHTAAAVALLQGNRP